MKPWHPMGIAPKGASILGWSDTRGVCRVIWTTCDGRWTIEAHSEDWAYDQDGKIVTVDDLIGWMELPKFDPTPAH